MRTSVNVILLIILVCTIAPGQNLPSGDAAYIDSLMSATYKPDQPGAVILVAKNGTPLFRKAYGLASVELSVPNKPELLFAIGSMSKQFTAVCMLQLVGQGKIGLNEPISRYLPAEMTRGRNITIAQLLSHTSGITSYTEKNDFATRVTKTYSKQEMIDYFMSDSLLFTPGTDWSYSNSGFYLAAYIIEKVSGMPFDSYMEKNIFRPLGLQHTVVGTEEHVIPGQVSGYDIAENGTIVPASYLNWSWPYGAGAILSNVDDLLKWDEALYTNTLVRPDLLKMAFEQFLLADGRKANYGFGWALGEYDGMKIIRHGGAINGFLSDAFRIPSQHLYVVVLSNSTGKSPSDIASKVAMRVAGKPLVTPEPIRLDPAALGEYTGVYEVHRAGSRLASNMSDEKNYRYLLIERDTLFHYRTGSAKSALLNVGTDLFVQKESNTYFRFHRGAGGEIATLEIYNLPVGYGPNEIEPKTALPLPKEREVLSLDEATLRPYAGRYDLGGGFTISVTVEPPKLFIQATGQERVEAFASSASTFFLKVVDATIEFTRDAKGTVTGLVLNQGGKYPGRKIE